VVSELENNLDETIWVEIRSKGQSVLLCNTYRSPCTDIDYWTRLIYAIELALKYIYQYDCFPKLTDNSCGPGLDSIFPTSSIKWSEKSKNNAFTFGFRPSPMGNSLEEYRAAIGIFHSHTCRLCEPFVIRTDTYLNIFRTNLRCSLLVCFSYN
jgi:hypothetical protein